MEKRFICGVDLSTLPYVIFGPDNETYCRDTAPDDILEFYVRCLHHEQSTTGSKAVSGEKPGEGKSNRRKGRGNGMRY